MRARHLLSVAVLLAALVPPPAAAAPAGGPVVDDFNGPAGAPPDPRLWGFDIAPSAEKGWEPGSLQTYTGQGIWPAVWMLGADIGTVGWPQSGEVDIIELVNTAATYYVTLHGPDTKLQSSGPIADLAADFHTYWATRRPGLVTIGVDGATLGTFTPENLPPGAPWVFDGPMFALLNVAVGGHWPGPPDASTPFPATMVVDWFRFDPI